MRILKSKLRSFKWEVMKVKVYAVRAKQLQQETLEERNTIKKERNPIPQTPSATFEEQITKAAHPSLTSPLPENISTGFAKGYSTSASEILPYDFSGKTNPI